MRKIILLSILMIGIAVSTPLSQTADGGYAGSFLQVPIGARPAAMGGAYLAISDDGAGILFNPAGLANLQDILFTTSYRSMQLDRKLGYAGIVFPVRGNSALGFHWLYAGSGDVAARDRDGYLVGHDFSINHHDVSAVFAKRFEKWIAIGTKINYYQSSVPEVSAFSVGFDFGAMIYIDQFFRRDRREDLTFQETQIGVTIKYVGVTFPWNSREYELAYGSSGNSFEQDDKIPVELGLGIATKVLDRKLLLAADLLKNEKQGAEFHGGTEYLVNEQLALRAGWGDGRLGFGSGYKFEIGDHLLSIDYAFSTAKADEGSEHIFSFDLRF